MSSDNTTYAFCLETLKYIYKILGYENTQKELNFIHHLNCPPVVETTVNKSVNNEETPTQPIINTPIVEKQEVQENIAIDTKNIIIETSESKYIRNEVPDNMRCDFILPTTKRCSFKKAENNNMCKRHTTK